MSNWSNQFGGPIILPTGSSAGHTHAATDITSSVLSTARLGTGSPSSANYLRGDGTWTTPVTSVNSSTGAVTITAAGIGAAASAHSHAAGDITSGTIATARLASGTANSTTYLRGDQTWATVSGGDTTYSLTVQDAENTVNQINILDFTVPANTWADGEMIFLDYLVRYNNTTGAQPSNLSFGILINGITYSFGSEQLFQNNSRTRRTLLPFWRFGTTMYVPRMNQTVTYQTIMGGNPLGTGDNVFIDNNFSTISNPFASNIIIRIYNKWDNAAPSLWARVINARAWKPSGQQT
jgi:hypothetical protein